METPEEGKQLQDLDVMTEKLLDDCIALSLQMCQLGCGHVGEFNSTVLGQLLVRLVSYLCCLVFLVLSSCKAGIPAYFRCINSICFQYKQSYLNSRERERFEHLLSELKNSFM